MSPKKKRQQRPARRDGSGPLVRTRREPVAAEPPSRWPVLLWVALALLWIVGTPLFLLIVVAEGFALLDADEVTAQARRTMAGHLLGMMSCALIAPLAGAVTAFFLHRRIAAALFAAALAVSLLALWVLAPPWEIAGAIWAGFRA